MELREKIRQLIESEGDALANPAAIRDTDDLFEAGLTSLGAVRLIVALEDSFQIEIPDALLDRAAFSSVDAIADLVDQVKRTT